VKRVSWGNLSGRHIHKEEAKRISRARWLEKGGGEKGKRTRANGRKENIQATLSLLRDERIEDVRTKES